VTALVEPPIVEVLPPCSYASKEAVIEAIGAVMIGAAAVTRAYVDGMLRKELEANTAVAAEVALPHGTADVRGAVLRNVLVIAPIPGGIEWNPQTPVRLAIGFAGTGDEAHLRLLGSVARVLADDDLLERLKSGTDTHRLAALFVSEHPHT
jgi:mannitol/fructose-specific phosphotransferase system IIA component